MPQSLLDRLLDDNARFDLGGRGTVNHLPMVLIALSRMGASDERLTEYFRWWEDNRALPRRESSQKVEDGQWQQYIGDASMFAALSDYFRQSIAGRSDHSTNDSLTGEAAPTDVGGPPAWLPRQHQRRNVASPARADDRGARAVCSLAAGESELKIALSSAEPATWRR
jgi:hypothetical protein